MSQQQRTLMISTCGTSLLTYEAERSLVKDLRESANCREQELSPEQRQKVGAVVDDCREKLLQSDTTAVRKMSAELNGMLGYYNNQFRGCDQDQHILIHTDTFQGEQVASILAGFLQSYKLNVSKQTFPDLRTDTIENFHRGITDLIKWCEDTLPGYRHCQYRVVFNLTGGFKSIQGWMQTLGMFYADEIVYIFESSSELLRIPRIPVAIDDGVRKTIEQHLDVFRRLASPGATCNVNDLKDIPEVFFYHLEDQVDLSPWGKLVWERSRNEIYGTRLLEPASVQIQYADKFRKVVGTLAKDRLVHVNERIDDLANYLRARTNPKRLDFKQLKSNPRPPSTHECDAWADKSALRIFCHFEGLTLILDDLAEGLH